MNTPGKGVFETVSGRLVDIPNPDQSDLCLDDIAHALSMQCRYNGHVKKFYSVAEHSCRVSYLLMEKSTRLAQLGLLHDASEAYLGDIVNPIKWMEFAKSYMDYEHVFQNVIQKKYGLGEMTDEEHDVVKWADRTILATEMRDLLNSDSWKNINLPPPLEFRLEPLSTPEKAKVLFLQYCRILGIED